MIARRGAEVNEPGHPEPATGEQARGPFSDVGVQAPERKMGQVGDCETAPEQVECPRLAGGARVPDAPTRCRPLSLKGTNAIQYSQDQDE
jgi:hypothetical protein